MSNDLTKDIRELLETGFENAYPVALNRSNLIKDAYGDGAEVILSNGHLKLKTYKNGDPVPIGVKDGVIAKADDGSDDILIAKDGIWVNKSGGGSSGVSSFNGRDGQVTLEEDDVLDALGYAPESFDNKNVAGGYVGFDSSKRIKLGRSINDQVRTLDVGGHINFDTVPNLSVAQMNAMTLTAINVGTGNIVAGTYYYGVSFVTMEGETGSPDSLAGLKSIVLASSSNVRLSSIPVSSDPRVTGRKIYRSQVSGQLYPLKLVGTINNNTTTTFDDTLANNVNIADSYYNKPNTTSGRLYFENAKVLETNIYSTSLGFNALANNTSTNNVAIGSNALRYSTSGGENTAIGAHAGVTDATGWYNVAIGYASQYFKTGGNWNTSIGYESLRCEINNQSFNYNTAIGTRALRRLLNDNTGNIGIGSFAGDGSQGGSELHGRYNTYIGYMAGYKSIPADSGRYNIAIGNNCGKALNTDNNIIIGNTVESPLSESGVINIGNVIYGRGCASGSTPSSTAKVGIGVSAPNKAFEVEGDAEISGNFLANGAIDARGSVTGDNLSGTNTGDETQDSVRDLLVGLIHSTNSKKLKPSDQFPLLNGSDLTFSKVYAGDIINTSLSEILANDFTLTNANQVYDILTITLSAGTWSVSAMTEMYKSASSSRFDGIAFKVNSVYISGYRKYVNSFTDYLTLNDIIQLDEESVVTLCVMSSNAGIIAKKYTSSTYFGSVCVSTKINAVKLY